MPSLEVMAEERVMAGFGAALYWMTTFQILWMPRVLMLWNQHHC
jgi:hypothetical protein